MMQNNNLIQLGENQPANQPEPKRKPTDLIKLRDAMLAAPQDINHKNFTKWCAHHKDDPPELKPASYFRQEVKDAFYPPGGIRPGIAPPWSKASDKIRFLPGDLSIWTGINGHGKSQFIGQIALDAMDKGLKVCIASLELKPKNLLKRLFRQAAAMEMPTNEYIDAIHEWTDDKLWIYDFTGNTQTSRILEVFAQAKQHHDIDIFIIDSMMRCGIAEDDLSGQKAFVGKLCDFKNQHNCHIHLITHPRKDKDETLIPGKMDICGSGSISNQADNCFTVWRNKKKEDDMQECFAEGKEPPEKLLNTADCSWKCDKQRNGEWEGKIKLWFDPKSFQYLNRRGDKPKQYVDFSNAKNINIKEINQEEKLK